MASSIATAVPTKFSTLCRGTGFVESGGPKVRFLEREVTQSLDRKMSLRRNKGSKKRAALPQTFATRRGIMLLYPNSFLSKKGLGLGKNDLGSLEASIVADSDFFSSEFKKWANTFLGEAAFSSSDEDEVADVLTELSPGNKTSQNPLHLLSADKDAAFSYGKKHRKIRPGLSARRYLINLTEGAESRLNCNWKGKGYVSDSTFFEANSVNPELKRKVRADLTETPEPYRLSHFSSTAPIHIYAFDYTLPLLNEDDDIVFDGKQIAEEKDDSKKEDQNEKEEKKGPVALPKIKKLGDYLKLGLDAKRTLLVDRLIQAAISMAIRKHKELFESYLKSNVIMEEENEMGAKRLQKPNKLPDMLKPAPWFDFNDVLTAIAYEQQYRREVAKAKLRGQHKTNYDGNPDLYTAPFSVYLRPRLLGGSKPQVSFQNTGPKAAQQQQGEHVFLQRNEHIFEDNAYEPSEDGDGARDISDNELEPSKNGEDNNDNSQTNAVATDGGPMLGRMFAEGYSPEMKRILKNIPVEIFEAVEDDLIYNLAKHANRIAKTVLAKPGNGKSLDKDTKLALEMWTKFLLEPLPQPTKKRHAPSLPSTTHITETRGTVQSSLSPRFSRRSETTQSSNFEQGKVERHEPGVERHSILKRRPLEDVHITSSSLPDLQKAVAMGPTSVPAKTVITKEFKGGFGDFPERPPEKEKHPAVSFKQTSSRQNKFTPKTTPSITTPSTTGRQPVSKVAPSEASFHKERAGPGLPGLTVGPKGQLPQTKPSENEATFSETAETKGNELLKLGGPEPPDEGIPSRQIPDAPETMVKPTVPSLPQLVPSTQTQAITQAPSAVSATQVIAQAAPAVSFQRPMLIAVTSGDSQQPVTSEVKQTVPMPSIPTKFFGPAQPAQPAMSSQQPPSKQGVPQLQGSAAAISGQVPQGTVAPPATPAITTAQTMPIKSEGPTTAVSLAQQRRSLTDVPTSSQQQSTAVPLAIEEEQHPSENAFPLQITQQLVSSSQEVAPSSEQQPQQATRTAPVPRQPSQAEAGKTKLLAPAGIAKQAGTTPSKKHRPQEADKTLAGTTLKVEKTAKAPRKKKAQGASADTDGEEDYSDDEELVSSGSEAASPSTITSDEEDEVSEGEEGEQKQEKIEQKTKAPIIFEKTIRTVRVVKESVDEPVDAPPPPVEKQEAVTNVAAPPTEKAKPKPITIDTDFDIVLDHIVAATDKEEIPKEEKPKKEPSPKKERGFVTGIPPPNKAKFLEVDRPSDKKKVAKKGKKKKGKGKDDDDHESEHEEEESSYSRFLVDEPEKDETVIKENLAPPADSLETKGKETAKEKAAPKEKKGGKAKLTRKKSKPAVVTEQVADVAEEAESLPKVVEEPIPVVVVPPEPPPVQVEKESSVLEEKAPVVEEEEPDFIFIARTPTPKPPSPPKFEILSEPEDEQPVVIAPVAAAEPTGPSAAIVSREEMMKRKRDAVEARRKERQRQKEEEARIAEEEAAKKDMIEFEIAREAKAIEDAAKADFDRRIEAQWMQEQEQEARAFEAEQLEQFQAFIAEQERLRMEGFKNKFKEEMKRRRTSRNLRRVEPVAVESMEALASMLEQAVEETTAEETVTEADGDGDPSTKRMTMLARKLAMEAKRKEALAEREALLQSYRRITASALERQRIFAKRLEHWGLLYHQFRLTRAFVWSYFSLLQWLRIGPHGEKLPPIEH